MELLKANAGTILVGAVVFAVLGAALGRVIHQFRRGKTGCCPGGCENCRGKKP
ncbi:MAG: FeoB-associated Cys-rich membrane protein [Treponema sp.]|jgi:hypothetical protein|nr:FeoB-associated Cys-rich membrane protein [Treponema sp.]